MPGLSERFQEFRKSSPLAFRLLAWILLFSTVFSLLASGIHILGEYRKDLDLIARRMQLVETRYGPSLARSLEASDRKLLQTRMEAILSLPDITHLSLRTGPESELVMGSYPQNVETRSHRFALVDNSDPPRTLGELTITVSLERLYRDMWRRVGIILASQFLNTFLAAILILWIFRYFVTRHLSAMARYAEDLCLNNLSQPLVLDRPDTAANRNDELGRVTSAINRMRERLNDDLTRQARDAANIRKFSEAIEQSPSSVLMCDRHWHIEYANQKFTQLSGIDADAIQGRHPSTLFETNSMGRSDMWQAIQLQVQRVGVWQGELNRVRKNGEHFWEQLTITQIRDPSGETTGYLILGEDISIRKRYEQQLLRQANYDILTGLPNRLLALDRLKLALAQAKRDGSMVGVMFLDMDNFKHINDTLGHDAGDALLVEVARRVAGVLRGASTVARLGGDEFLIVLPGLANAEASSQIAERILGTFNTPFLLNGQEVFVTISIGIAIFPTDSDNTTTLLQQADAAMYQAKHRGKSGYSHFSPEMSEVSPERLQMEAQLRLALQQQDFELHYQPIIHNGSGTLYGAEALLRWNSPHLGMIMPERFISLAEETGLITGIGEWVLAEACRAAADWRQRTGQDLVIAINVSPRQFRDPGFTRAVTGALESSGLPAELLELEITERLILDNSIETTAVLRHLDELGARLSLDDFGTGYSALSYLKTYPFDTLKIDRSFTRDVIRDQDSANLVRAIINMAHSLGLKVIAEGVEDEAQARFLIHEGCDFAQGYLYSRPRPATKFLRWLKRNRHVSS